MYRGTSTICSVKDLASSTTYLARVKTIRVNGGSRYSDCVRFRLKVKFNVRLFAFSFAFTNWECLKRTVKFCNTTMWLSSLECDAMLCVCSSPECDATLCVCPSQECNARHEFVMNADFWANVILKDFNACLRDAKIYCKISIFTSHNLQHDMHCWFIWWNLDCIKYGNWWYNLLKFLFTKHRTCYQH